MAAWSKLEGYAARLALIIHCVRDAFDDPTLANVDEVDLQSIEAGITLSRWFANEARRVYAMFAESDEDRDARQLVEWIGRKGGSVTPRDLSRGPRRFRDNPGDAEAALGSLVEAGIGTWEHDAHDGGRGRPTRRFVLTENTGDTGDGDENSENPDENSENPDENDNFVTVATVTGCDGDFPDGPPLEHYNNRADDEATPDDGGEWGTI